MGRLKSPVRKTQLNTRIRKETAQFLREKFASPAEAVEECSRFLIEAEEMVRDALNSLTHQFISVVGISLASPLIMPGITLFDRVERGLEEKVILVDLLSEGTWRVLKRKQVGIGTNLYAVWGKQLGKALSLNPKACLILGEFCHSWMSGKGSRVREFSGAVADCEKRFAEFVQNGKRKLFERSEKERYRKGWNSMLQMVEPGFPH
jgi:hypothetical protein